MPSSLSSRLRERARALKRDLGALAIAARDPRTPLAAKLVAGLTLAYALSPVDLIPDFIPVLGLLDDLILVPLGLALAIRLIPPDVLEDARTREAERPPQSLVGAALVIGVWVILAVATALAILRRVR